MKNGRSTPGRQLDRLFRLGTVSGLTDSQLLEQLVAGDDEAAELAFEALVDRHGPMVFRVCRRVLRDVHAAEDAFQATFLVLAPRPKHSAPATCWATGFTASHPVLPERPRLPPSGGELSSYRRRSKSQP